MKRSCMGLGVALGFTLLTACAVGPDYHRPAIEASEHYKEQGDWKPSAPSETLSRGPWWRIYQDDELSTLEAQIEISNQNVKAAAAAFDQAQALIAQAGAGFWPTFSATTGWRRGAIGTAPAQSTDNAALSANWNLDIWGQIRRSTEGNRASAQASAAALAAATLSAQAALASDYFQLRAQDQLQRLLDDIVEAEQRSLSIAESRYRFGVAAKADVVSARAQFLSGQAQQVNAKIQRALLEHAIAVLIGRQPAAFSLVRAQLRTDVPIVPAGLPSTLLERRPDVAQAERRVAAANAQIGVARAAFFPSLILGGTDGYTGSGFSRLIRVPNRVWSLGPSLAETLFDGGLRRAIEAQARAAYEASVALYRQTVLASFGQVEDDLVTLRVLEQQAVIEDAAVAAAREAEKLTLNQYKAGTVPYSSVITSQTTRLNSEQTALAVLSNRLQASVALIAALGGGWTSSAAAH